MLEPSVFAPALSRLWWLPVHAACIALCAAAITRGWVAPGWRVLLTLPIAASFAGLTFLGHETLHGAIVRNKTVRKLIGFVGFLPFAGSPRLWVAGHNRVHHGNANRPGIDPDAYPTLAEYRGNRAVRIATDYGAPGREELTRVLAPLVRLSV